MKSPERKRHSIHLRSALPPVGANAIVSPSSSMSASPFMNHSRILHHASAMALTCFALSRAAAPPLKATSRVLPTPTSNESGSPGLRSQESDAGRADTSVGCASGARGRAAGVGVRRGPGYGVERSRDRTYCIKSFGARGTVLNEGPLL